VDLGLKGRRVLVTGASRGIGLAIARTFVAEGASVAICARGESRLKEVAEELAAGGATVHAQAVDVGDGDALREFVDASAVALGGLDVIVANTSASVGRGAEAWQQSFDIDLMGLVVLIQAATPHLERAGAGAVVAIATTSALEAGALPTANSYAALKAAVIQHASAQSHALGAKGIRVNAVSPGPVYFEGGDWEKIKVGMPDLYEAALASAALGRLGSPEDVANAVVFLASPAAGHVTGVNLVVDGGFTNRVDF
jgi:NAD(P)-dependent dehydrogenase (short-subunit alcohol dehydrogenase family)